MNYNFRLSVVLLAASTLFLVQVRANPLAGVVVNGAANINNVGSLLTINQASDRAIINWGSFNIANGETTLFQFNGLAGANSAVLNRVNIGNPSVIAGMLRSTVGPGGPVGGTVMILNPSGMLFTPTAQINVGNFVATTLGLVDDRQFLNGANLSLSGPSTAAIRNQGNISALGDVFLIAHTVENAGNIAAGNVAGLAAGTTVTLAEAGNERVTVQAGTPGTGAAVGVDNTAAGRINATVAELKAAGGNIYALAINNGGIVRANSLVNQNGRISLRASGGNIQNSGTLSANNADGSGGTIVVDGGHNAAAPSTVLNSGTITARGEAAGTKGGTVELLGDHVGLFDESLVDVSGQAGGGTALVGGDLHGANPAVPNAEATFVGPNARVKADALTFGNGGEAVVWADDTTRFYGSASARGGVLGGNGGLLEVSGHRSLDFQGFASTAAPAGNAGTLLLDPFTDLTIDNTSDQFVTPGPTTFSPNGTPSHLTWTSIKNALSGNNVVVTTTGSPDNIQPGDITVAAGNLDAGGPGDLASANRLTLDAVGTLRFNADIKNTGGGDFVFNGASGINLGANLTSAGAQTFNNPVTLTGNSQLHGTTLTLAAGLAGAGATTCCWTLRV